MKYRLLALVVLISNLYAGPQHICVKFSTSDGANSCVQSSNNAKAAFRSPVASQNGLAVQVENTAAMKELQKWVVIAMDEHADADSAIAVLRLSYAIDYAAPAHRFRLDRVTVGDSLRSSQWALDKLRADDVWNIATGKGVVVAIIDTGIEWDHEDLRTQLWTNSLEDLNHNGTFEPWPSTETRNGISGDLDGIDNDGNGFVDDVIGYNFVNQAVGNLGDWKDRDAFPFDEQGHGTSVAGVIAATKDNKHGVAGLAYNAHIMPLRSFDVSGNAEEDDVAAAIVYAAMNGARVINCSFGDVVQSVIVHDAMWFAHEQGVVIVASSGNSGGPGVHYPSDYNSVISVGASSARDARALFSSYNAELSLMAPGEDITTTTIGNSYNSLNGTSFSSPMVAASVALLLEKHPEFGPAQVRELLERTAFPLDSLTWSVQLGAGRLDILAALSAQGSGGIQIDEPQLDAVYTRDSVQSIIIRGSISNPLMKQWTVQVGKGLDPKVWTDVKSSDEELDSSTIIASVSLSNLVDTLYTARIVALQRNGKTIHRSTRFRVMPSRLHILTSNAYPEWFSNQRAIGIELKTDRPAFVRAECVVNGLHYQSSSQHFGLDHYIVLQPQRASGRITVVALAMTPSGDTVSVAIPLNMTSEQIQDTCFVRKKFSAMRLFLNPDAVSKSGKEFVATDLAQSNRPLALFSAKLGKIQKVDSLNQTWFTRGVGDSNGNGIDETFVYSGGKSELIERSGARAFSNVVFADSASYSFWACRMADVTGDGKPDLLGFRTGRFNFNKGNPVQRSDAMELWSYRNGSYTMLGQAEIASHPPADKSINLFSSPGCAVGDFDHDGKIEIAFTDADGDFQISEWSGTAFTTELIAENGKDSDGGTEFTTEVDIDGDGTPEILSGYPSSSRTSSDGEYEPSVWTFRLFKSDSVNSYKVVWTDRFNGVRYGKPYYNGVAKGQLDDKAGEEVVLSLFPNVYVFTKSSDGKTLQPLWMHSGAWSNSAMITDLDSNGRNELAFASSESDSTEWWEYNLPTNALPPPTGIVLRKTSTDSLTFSWNAVSGAAVYRLDIDKLFGIDGISWSDTTSSTSYTFHCLTTPAAVLDTRLFVSIHSLASATDTSTSAKSRRMRFPLYSDLRMTSCAAFNNDARTLLARFDGDITRSVIPEAGWSVVSADARTHYAVSSCVLASDSTMILQLATTTVLQGDYTVTLDSSLAYTQFPPVSGRVLAPLAVQTDSCCPLSFKRIVAFTTTSLTAEFSEAVTASALSPANYALTNNASLTAIRFDNATHNVVHFDFDAASPLDARGFVYSLIAAPNVAAVSGRGMTTGAGNTLSWVYQPSSIDDAYAFPEPIKLNESSTVHFAGVPVGASVVVMTLEGVELAHIREQSGTGGVTWQAQLPNGESPSTGIYLFKIVLSDGTESVQKKFLMIQ